MPTLHTFFDFQQMREQFGTIVPGGMQIIDWTWRDQQTYSSASDTEVNFFTAVNTNKVKSNMVSAGDIPSPEWFIVRAITIVPIIEPSYENLTDADAAGGGYAVSAAVDMFRLLFQSRLEMFIGSSKHFDMISANFTSGQGIYGYATSDGASGATAVLESNRLVVANNGVPDPRAVWTLNHPKLLEPKLNFQVSMKWNSAVTLSGDTDIRVGLVGSRIRPLQ